ncbi:histidinol-phosphate transaminase [Roseospirillum parvum]|uniref:Histidinol-phosphate aminotransferase n=1 Tax=Roseospirillum parvum TaxID=83401 RepID=A0A1G8BS73_9PROT|nr:histidinol-phosphate transaminase [Roseospirillum parvum]SDH35948.1 histidinol-phosphate aminotransferase [Roseospirillum parvum]
MTTPTPRPGILDIAPYVGGESELEGLARVIKLSSNEGALGPSPRAMEAHRRAAEEMHRYPDGGAEALRQAIAARHGLDAAHIVCGAGSDELIGLLVKAYVGPGDEVLYSAHGFLMYRLYTLGCGGVPVTAPEDNLTASVDNILARVSEKTRIVFLANPNNPTGTCLSADEVARLRAGLPDHVLLAIDAAYAEYVGRNDYSAGAELVARTDNTVMLRTFSKMYGLGGVRLGWAYAPEAVVDHLNRLRSPFNVSAPAQAAGIAAVEDVAFQDLCRAHNDMWLPWLTEKLRGLGLEVGDSHGNFVLATFPGSGPHTVEAADAFLKSRGLIARRVAGYGLPHSLRITVGADEENRLLVAALDEFMAA